MIHFVSGGLGSGVGLLVTYPLDLIRIRLQSQIGIKGESYHNNILKNNIFPTNILKNNCGKIPYTKVSPQIPIISNIYKQLADLHLIKNVKLIIINEGVRGLYKGLGASVVAFIPTKAVYFFCYNAAKSELNKGKYLTPNTAPVHMFSAAFAGLSVCVTFNPIHVIKTRLQLNSGNMNVRECLKYTFKHHGISGFYRGMEASTYGVSEMVIQFMIYEKIKHDLHTWLSKYNVPLYWLSEDPKVAHFMIAGAISKFVAVVTTYPHEVIRTRTREVGYKGQGFWTLIYHITKNEGYKALYRGMGTTLIRSVPNSAIALTAYEYFVKFFNKILN